MPRGWFFDEFDIYSGLYDEFSDFGGRHPRAGGAAVSQRALNAQENAKKNFLSFLATADTSKGDVTEQIIKFHLVPDMKMAFSKFVKEHRCQAIPRKLTRTEQDQINPGRKSLMVFTSVTVSAVAQSEYIRKYPKEAEMARAKCAANKVKPGAGEPSSSKAPAVTQRDPLASKKRNVSDAGLIEPSGSGAKKTKIT